MIVDSCALVAILKGEPDAEAIAAVMLRAAQCRMSVANWFEAAMVADRLGGPDNAPLFDDLVAEFDIELVELDVPMARVARQAFHRYGRGTKHPAKLNFGDCMAYALAKSTGEPLLFKGNDFIHTDITPALH